MKIELRTYCAMAEITIESGNTKIVEDVAYGHRSDEMLIQQFIVIAGEMNRYNKDGDIDLVERIATYLLNDIEHEQLIKRLSL